MRQIPLTNNFSQDLSRVLGKIEIVPEGLNPSADMIMEAFKKNPMAFTFEPGYIVHEDGSTELLEISLVPRYPSSMALDDLIDDLAD